MSFEKTFLFNSGGRNQSANFGEWDVILDSEGRISITQFVGDDVHFSGMSALEERSDRLWSMIDAIDLNQVSYDEREGKPEELEYRFDYKNENIDVSKIFWSEDVHSNAKIMELLEEIQKIIEIVSGKSPKF